MTTALLAYLSFLTFFLTVWTGRKRRAEKRAAKRAQYRKFCIRVEEIKEKIIYSTNINDCNRAQSNITSLIGQYENTAIRPCDLKACVRSLRQILTMTRAVCEKQERIRYGEQIVERVLKIKN